MVTARLAAMMLAFGVLAGCKTSDRALSDQTCLGAEVTLSQGPCDASVQCHAGSACGADDAGSPSRCRPGLEHLRRTQLMTGFMVDELPLHLDSDAGSALLSWRAPAGTSFVTCVVFGCAPEIAQGAESVVISNFDQCVLRRQTFSGATEGTFEPNVADDSTAACRIDEFVTELSVGCWAYDDVHLTAASKLVTVRPSQIPALESLAVDECHPLGDERSTERLACFRGVDVAYGICHLGNCRRRCDTEGSPCDALASSAASAEGDADLETDAPSRAASGASCVALLGTLGVCVPAGGNDD